MEWALHEIELASLQALAIDELRNELDAADDQLYIYDMATENLTRQIDMLETELILAQEQLNLTQRSVDTLAQARRRASFWGKAASVAAAAATVIAILK